MKSVIESTARDSINFDELRSRSSKAIRELLEIAISREESGAGGVRLPANLIQESKAYYPRFVREGKNSYLSLIHISIISCVPFVLFYMFKNSIVEYSLLFYALMCAYMFMYYSEYGNSKYIKNILGDVAHVKDEEYYLTGLEAVLFSKNQDQIESFNWYGVIIGYGIAILPLCLIGAPWFGKTKEFENGIVMLSFMCLSFCLLVIKKSKKRKVTK